VQRAQQQRDRIAQRGGRAGGVAQQRQQRAQGGERAARVSGVPRGRQAAVHARQHMLHAARLQDLRPARLLSTQARSSNMPALLVSSTCV